MRINIYQNKHSCNVRYLVLIILHTMVITSSLIIASCGKVENNDSGKTDNKDSLAPTSLQGKVIKRTIKAGNGVFASKGISTITFSSHSNTYIKVDKNNNVADSAGTYTYINNGNTGTVSIKDSSLSFATCVFIFSDKKSGTFKCTVASDVAAKQSGDFSL